ncbi:MAG: dTDP-4-dehydrorhamnose reductase [Burkholderiales bacterium]|nr:dTDP-4-dehydrorhamnose reductase [Burkholderiales bacterium]
MTTILLAGKTGQVGHELITALAPMGRVIAVGRDQFDLTRADSIIAGIREIAPDIIVNAAAFTAVDDAETAPERAMQVNATAPGLMAEEARRSGALLVHYSTDYVFDGSKAGAYLENDTPNPVNVYGRSKLEGERNIAVSGCRHLILRTSWTYGAQGTNFLRTMLRLARLHAELEVVTDQFGSPTWSRELALATIRILQSPRLTPETLGTYHLSAEGHTSRFAFAQAIIEMARQASGTETGWATIKPTTTANYSKPAARPLNAATSKEKIGGMLGITMPHWTEQLREYIPLMVRGELLQRKQA